MPEYVAYFALAEKLGVKVHPAACLEDVPLYWREAAVVLMRAHQIVQERRDAERHQK